MPKCPECHRESVERYEWSDGAVTEDCAACPYWDWQPPTPGVRR